MTLFWTTGIGMMDAAEQIVEEAVSNGNIPAEDSDWRVKGAHFPTSAVKRRRMKKKAKP